MNKKSVLSLLFVCMSLSGMAQGFIHPGILHTQADFDRVKEKLATGQEPWTAAYNKLMTSKHVDLNWKPNPTVKIIRGGWNVWEPEGDNYGAAMNDAATAYQCALVWRITGDERYAEKSVEIMNAWARTCKKVSGNSNGSLASGLYGYEFANAGELMRDYEGWNREDFKRYQQWMLRVFSDQSFGFLQERHGCADDHYWSNWGCVMCCAKSVWVFCATTFMCIMPVWSIISIWRSTVMRRLFAIWYGNSIRTTVAPSVILAKCRNPTVTKGTLPWLWFWRRMCVGRV